MTPVNGVIAAPAPIPPTAQLHGRAREWAAVSALLAGAAAGQGGALLLEGDPGTGRSTLLSAAVTAAAHAGFTVLATEGLVEEAQLPYAGLHRLLRPVRDRLSDLPAHRAAALTGLLAGDLPPLATGELARCTALLALLEAVAGAQPLLCAVDDADCLDPASAAALGLVARRLTGTRLALLATAAAPATAAEPTITGVPTLRLGPLDPPASLAVLRDRVPGPGPAGLPPRLAAPLLRLAGGVPQALVDLAGALTPRQLAGTAPPPTTLPPDSGLRRGYQRWLRRLPEDTRWLLLVIAAAGRPRIAALVQAAQHSGVDIAALAPAERAGLVQAREGTVGFGHPLVRGLVYEAAPLVARRQALLCLAEAAATTGDYRRAADAMARAAALSCHAAEAAGHQVAAARYAWLAGRPGQARRLLQQARQAATGPVAGEMKLLSSEIELRTGEAGTALRTLLATATVLADERRDLALHALLRAVEAAWFTGDHTGYAEIAAQAAALQHPGLGPAERQILAYVAGFTANFQGRPQAAAEALRQAVTLADQVPEVAALTLAAWAGLLLADYPTAQRLARRAVEAARDRGEAAALPLAYELQARAWFAAGRFDEADASCRAGLAAAHAGGQPCYAADHSALRAVLAAVRGEAGACRRQLRELALPTGAGPVSRPAALSQWALAVLDLTAGRPAEAAARLAGLGDPVTGHGQVTVQLMAAPWLVEAAAGGTERRVARSVLALYDRWARSTVPGLPAALAARCRALLAPPGSPAATGYFQQARRLHRLGECDFERARTELLYGQALRRQRRPRDARRHLHRALEIFRQLSLTSWADRARAELRAAGEQVAGDEPAAVPPPVPPPAITGGPATCPAAELLTAQQRRIARLVALGATNREVAAQLFLSPRTVDHHLRNIFHRLGIRSRVELARLLA